MTNDRDRYFEWPDQRCRIAWRALMAQELGFNLASEAVKVLVAARQRGCLYERLWAGVRMLDQDSAMLGEVLIEIIEEEERLGDLLHRKSL